MSSVTPSIDFFSIIGIVAIGQGLLVGSYFLFKKNTENTQASFLLGLLIATFVFQLFVDLLHYSGFILKAPQFFGLTYFFRFAYGPLIYLYVRSIAVKSSKLRLIDILHFIPFLYIHISLLPKYLWPNEFKVSYLIQKFEAMSYDNLVLKEIVFLDELTRFFWFHLQPLIYLSLAVYLLHKHRKAVHQQYSFASRIDLNWMRNIFYGFLLFWLVSYVTELFITFQYGLLWIRMMFLSVHVFAISYMALHQPPVGSRLIEKKYKASTLDISEAPGLTARILDHMQVAKPYLKPELSLNELSKELDLNPRHLSQIINGEIGENFFQFVNQYRVRESQRLLLLPEYSNYSIEGIGNEVGFKSKMAFYRAFKKYVGMTPTEYKHSPDPSEIQLDWQLN